MIIKSAYIEKFRAIQNLDISVGENLTCICGRNGTMKTTLMGILAHPFSCSKRKDDIENMKSIVNHKTIEQFTFQSKFQDKFRISEEYDKIGDHKWTINFKEGGSKEVITITSQERKENGKVSLRFWNEESREKGAGNLIVPVYYLSLSRTFPIGENKGEKNIDIELTEEEKNFYIDNYKEILNIHAKNLENANIELKNKNKTISFVGPKTDYYDVDSISAGESSIGRILLAILSFKRLKDNCEDYKAGLLFIDEIETTFYPQAQKKLICFLKKMSKNLKIQIIFTTHSPIILEEMNELQRKSINKKTKKYNNSYEIINLTKSKGVVKADMIKNSYDFKKILNGLELKSTTNEYNIKIYTEDKVAQEAVKCMLRNSKLANIVNKLKFENIDLGYTEYLKLIKKGIEEFTRSIVILDGDVEEKLMKEAEHKKIFDENSNCLLSPITVEPDMFKFLYEENNMDNFIKVYTKDTNNGHIDYEIIFNGYTKSLDSYKKEHFKNWYKEIKEKHKITDEMLIKSWLMEKENIKKKTKFIKEFKKAYNSLADELKIDKIL